MKLESYLENTNTSVATLAAAIGVKRQTVYSYLRKEKIPSADTMARVVEVTGGAVTPNDFYDIGGAS